MNIKFDSRIRDKYHQGFERPNDPDTVVIHGTGGGSDIDGLLSWMLGGERAENYERGISLFHYAIDRDGEVVQLIPDDRYVIHSSSGRRRDGSWRDETTLGIELLNPDPHNREKYTSAQYAALSDLLFKNIMVAFDIRTIMSHSRCFDKYSRAFAGKSKDVPCPGPLFDWDFLAKMMQDESYKFEHDAQFESFWNIEYKGFYDD